MTQLALVIDLNVCVGCHACVTSCKEWNTSGEAGALADLMPYGEDPVGTFLNRVQTFEVGQFPETQTVHFPKSCLHCEDPPCVPVCPTGASYKRAEDGIVLVDYDKCIGCKYCAWACPYGVRELDAKSKVMKKCTLCVDRIYDQALPEADRKPACVMACPTNARLFGDVHDPGSEVSRAIAERGGYALMPEWGPAPPTSACPENWCRSRILENRLRHHLLMRPALSVVFLTTLIGAGQGLFLGMYAAEAAAALGWVDSVPARRFFVVGSVVALALCALGLLASFFHLGRPERAWRTAAMWRTSWLSREVIALPLFMALAFAYGWLHYADRGGTLAIGALAAVACLALFYCTAMIYACIRFLQEWASPFTVTNFLLMGCASGATLTALLSTLYARQLSQQLAIAAAVLTAAALLSRLASLARNARIRHKSSLQTAIGVANPRIRQVSQGFTGNSFNTLEFFHGLPAIGMRSIAVAFIVFAFVLPLVLVGLAIVAASSGTLALAWLTQYAGLLMERWHFLAQSHHPQNLYYQNRS